MFLEVFVDELEPLIRQDEFDIGKFRHSTLIFDETITFAEQRPFQNPDRSISGNVQCSLESEKFRSEQVRRKYQ